MKMFYYVNRYPPPPPEDLTIIAILNIPVDIILKHTTQIQVNTHILNTSLSIYFNNKYFPNNYVASIWSHYVELDTRECLIEKNG